MGVNMKVFDSLEIRNTSVHISLVYSTPDPTKPKLIIYKNGLNRSVNLQVQGSIDKDFTHPVNIGDAFSAPASMANAAYETVMDAWKYLRLIAQCSTAPTSGSLDAWIE